MIENEQILFYSKATEALDNIILVMVNVDPFNSQSGFAYVPIENFSIEASDPYQVEDLITGEKYHLAGPPQFRDARPAFSPGACFSGPPLGWNGRLASDLRMSKAVWLTVCIAVLLFGCGQSKEQAIQELEKLNLKFTPDDFVRSAENGDMKAIQLFLDAGIDCNAQSGGGLTALMAASKKGRIDVVKKLLDQKVKIDAQGKDGVTALMLAADSNQLDIVNLLLKKNADPNIEDQARLDGFDGCCVSRVTQTVSKPLRRDPVRRSIVVCWLPL